MLQDYLDGRLSPEERSEFEALLERDAGLAGRVEACREYGRALREDPPELPPGFYTRARARFEQEQAARKPRRFSMFSWELAGLAAAAALAGVLFIPGLVQWDRQGAPFVEEVTTAAWEKKAIAAADEPAAEMDMDVSDALPEQPARIEQAKGPAPAPPPTAAAESTPPLLKREKKGPRAARRRETEMGLGMMDAEGADSYRQQDRIQLPPGVVEAGDLIIIETEQQWLNLIGGPARGSELSSRGYDRHSRWVLIGARPERFDCAGIEIVASPDSYRFLLRIEVDPALVAEYGCAILLPRDGRSIEIVSSWIDSHE
jgi:hypothetical protein